MSSLPINSVLSSVLKTLKLKFPECVFGDGVTPTIKSLDTPFGVVYNLGTNSSWGTLGQPDAQCYLDLQVSIIGLRRDAVTILADDINKMFMLRDSTSNFATPFESLNQLATELLVYVADRIFLETSGLSVEGNPPNQRMTYANRYRLALVQG